jgi:tRNA-binding protein
MSSGSQALKAQITFGKFQNVDMRVGRVIAAPTAEGTKAPCRVITVDLGEHGTRTSVGQYALLEEEELVGKNVIVCVNLGAREMGPYTSEALVLGVPHPDSPSDQSQALPLFVDDRAVPGSQVF